MTTMRSHLRKLVRGTSGQEIIEAAVVIPLLFTILFGVYWFGRAFNIYGTINHAAREGARVAISNCATCGNTPATNAQIAAAVTQALQASHLDPAKATAYTPAPAPTPVSGCANAVTVGAGSVSICQPVQLNAGSTDPPVFGVTVSFKYPYQFWFPFTSLNSVSLKASVQANGEE